MKHNGKTYKLLTAEPNGVDIFYNKETGYTYFTGRAAERECKKQGLKLMDNRKEVGEFINTFEGNTEQEKVISFVEKMGLKKAGYWGPNGKKWGSVGSVGYARLSRVDGSDNVYEVRWSVDHARINRIDQEYPSPFVVCEDCSSEADTTLLGRALENNISVKAYEKLKVLLSNR